MLECRKRFTESLCANLELSFRQSERPCETRAPCRQQYLVNLSDSTKLDTQKTCHKRVCWDLATNHVGSHGFTQSHTRWPVCRTKKLDPSVDVKLCLIQCPSGIQSDCVRGCDLRCLDDTMIDLCITKRSILMGRKAYASLVFKTLGRSKIGPPQAILADRCANN